MNRKYLIGFFAIVALLATVSIFDETVSAKTDGDANGSSALAPILVENFDYSAGALLTDNGWTAHSAAGTNALTVSAPGLTLTGYPSSGIGNAVALTTSGEDANRSFTTQTSGSVYAGFLVNASEAAADALGGYFFHLGPEAIGTTFRGRVWLKKDASNNVAFGISKGSSTEVVFTPFSYALNTTYLVVLKYTIVDGATNDTVSLFVSSTVPATEPASPTASATDTIQTDINPGSVALRQGSAATSPTVRVDGIRVGTAWSDIVTAAPAQNIIDFNGDGKTDYAISRNVGSGPSGQRRWFYRLNGSATTAAVDWGIASDTMVPADYDGDNKTDIAVWRPISSGQPANNAFFYILQSTNNTVRVESFGQQGDEPRVVGDYDGDGKDDLAVVRKGANGTDPMTWFYRGSLNNPGGNITFVNWGISSDSLSIGDYDGDGKNDFVIVRDNGQGSNTFWLRQSTAGISVRTFGPSIFPDGAALPYDFDGDGKTDIGVVVPTTQPAQWYYQPSSGGNFVQVGFGTESTDVPAVGDYDGDGRADIAIWRMDGSFWIRNSGNNSISIVPWGSSGDEAVAGYLFY